MRLFLTLDTEKYCPGPAPSIAEQLIQEGIHTPVRGLTIFHPTRIMFTSKTDYDYGSDVLLRALKRFHDAGHDFTFIVVRKGTPDEPDFENIIAKTEFADRVIWIPFQTREKLIHWYRACDLVTSEFGFGGFGSISLEAMACGAPLMTAFRTEYPDPTFFLPSFDSLPPTYPANSEDQAAEQLLLWATDRRLRERKRLEGREWVIRNSSPAALAPKFLDAYQRAIQTHPVSPLPITYPEPTAIHFRTIALHLRRKDFTGALGAIATALDDSPEHPVLLGALADTFYAMGERGLHFALRQELNLLGIEIRR